MTGDSALLFHHQQNRRRCRSRAGSRAPAARDRSCSPLRHSRAARTRPVVRNAGRLRRRQRFPVHPRQSQHGAGLRFLRDRRNQSIVVPLYIVEPAHGVGRISIPAAAIAALASPHRVLAVVEDAGREHRVGAALAECRRPDRAMRPRRRMRSPGRRPHRRPRASSRDRSRVARRRGPCWSGGFRPTPSFDQPARPFDRVEPGRSRAAMRIDLASARAPTVSRRSPPTMHCAP